MEINAWSWKAKGSLQPLSAEGVHLWHIPLDQAGIPIPVLARFLSQAEIHRANRFNFKVDQQRYQTAHTAVRMILANYLNIHPAEIQFEENSCGKPSLLLNPDVRFNLSHTDGWALLAVGLRREVGVDIERIRPDLVDPIMIRNSFAPAEAKSLTGLSLDRQAEAFFKLWTRKEALLKAVGTGLSLPLGRFEVSLSPDTGPVELIWRSDPPQKQVWTIHAVDPPAGCAAALAAEGESWQVVEHQWVNYFSTSTI